MNDPTSIRELLRQEVCRAAEELRQLLGQIPEAIKIEPANNAAAGTNLTRTLRIAITVVDEAKERAIQALAAEADAIEERAVTAAAAKKALQEKLASITGKRRRGSEPPETDEAATKQEAGVFKSQRRENTICTPALEAQQADSITDTAHLFASAAKITAATSLSTPVLDHLNSHGVDTLQQQPLAHAQQSPFILPNSKTPFSFSSPASDFTPCIKLPAHDAQERCSTDTNNRKRKADFDADDGGLDVPTDSKRTKCNSGAASESSFADPLKRKPSCRNCQASGTVCDGKARCANCPDYIFCSYYARDKGSGCIDVKCKWMHPGQEYA